MSIRTCVLYVRISLRTEESVSIDRQIEAGEAYARSKGWKVVGVFRDEGVSATSNRPADRDGWRSLLESSTRFDAVIIWKVDRLARRVMDFLTANEAVQAKGAGLVAVADPIDMTTPLGRALATLLAIFAEMEAEAISARTRAAREHLLKAGRYTGGVPPYGYRAVPNPDGAGYILAHDDAEIGYVREVVRRTMDGLSLYSSKQWLEEVGAPTRLGGKGWPYTTLDRIVRHPILAGMIPHNPGNVDRHRGDGLLRDESGLPVVDDSLAIMTTGEWRALQAKLDEPSPQRQPRALRGQSSGLLSGLMWCANHEEPVKMWRKNLGTGEHRRHAYFCRECKQTITEPDNSVIQMVMDVGADQPVFNRVEEVVEGGAVQLQEASIRLGELGAEMVNASPDRAIEIVAEMQRLKLVQEEARAQPAQVRYVNVGEARTWRQHWENAGDDVEAQRLVLDMAIRRVLVRRGVWGSHTEEGRRARMDIEWFLVRPWDESDEVAPTDPD